MEEECNIKVDLDYKICATWHTYTMNGKQMMKKTTWYAMTCTDASKMAPQVEEEIEEVNKKMMDLMERRKKICTSEMTGFVWLMTQK